MTSCRIARDTDYAKYYFPRFIAEGNQLNAPVRLIGDRPGPGQEPNAFNCINIISYIAINKGFDLTNYRLRVSGSLCLPHFISTAPNLHREKGLKN